MSLTVAQLTERLLTSYERAGGTNHVDGKNLPSEHAVAGIATDLLRLLFPGFLTTGRSTPPRWRTSPAP
jgi:serine O-acetyltransferase